MLIDSHVLLWLAADDPSLGPLTRAAITGSERVLVSSLTMIELEVKRLSGRLMMPYDFIRRAFGEVGVEELPFTAAHAGELKAFPELIGHDPFDRALLAQATAEGIEFITADRRLLALERAWIRDARQ